MSSIYTTEGIVFRSFKYGETSMIADIYSKSHGLKAYIAGSVRTKKAGGKANVFYPGNIVEVTAYPSGEDKLARLKEINYAYNYKSLNQDVVPSCVGAFMIELCRGTIKEKEPNEQLYDFIVGRLKMVDGGLFKLKVFHLKFMLDLASYLGFELFNNYDENHPHFDLREGLFVSSNEMKAILLDPGLSKQLSQLMDTSMHNLNDFQIEKPERDNLLDKVIAFYKYHIEGFTEMKSLEVLRTILS